MKNLTALFTAIFCMATAGFAQTASEDYARFVESKIQIITNHKKHKNQVQKSISY